jgi:ribosomal protein S18 acetylase RimI-like enzyme
MHIERASVADAAAIQAVLRETWLDTYSPYMARATLDEVTATWHDLPMLEARLKDPAIFFAVARDGGEGIAGFVTAQRRAEEELFIYRLYVRPDVQHQGLGTALYHATLDAFPGVSRVRLQVVAQNRKGFAFWKKLGFTTHAVREETVAGERIPITDMEKTLL